MTVLHFKSGILELSLNRCFINTYYVTFYHPYGIGKCIYYSSLDYTKEQSYRLFVRLSNWLVQKSYLSY